LIDRGSFWQTTAVYRGGDNPTAVQVYKNTGTWKDYVEDTEFLPFEVLLKKTLNTRDDLKIRELLKGIKSNIEQETKQKKLLSEEKTYNPTCLKKLLPHYDFYSKPPRSISQETLKDYQCGLANSGKLYQRIVFPIFNKDGKIHGFSGRKILDKNDSPKWLHLGKKTNWFYPYYSNPKTENAIKEKRSVYLVESIGDSLALYDAGIENNLVCFGTAISPKFISYLSSLNVDKIYVSLNNDFQSERNRGFEGSLKVIFKLSEIIDFKKIYFAPPHKNDFGAMNKIDIDSFNSQIEKTDHKLSISNIIEFGKQINTETKQPPAFSKNLKNLCKLYNFNYG
jgi:hypothetical protein